MLVDMFHPVSEKFISEKFPPVETIKTLFDLMNTQSNREKLRWMFYL